MTAKGLYLENDGSHKRIAKKTIKWLDLIIKSVNRDSFMYQFRQNAAQYRVLTLDNKIKNVFNNLEII